MTDGRHFEYGEQILARQVRYGKCWLEAPVRVLRDDDELLVTYLFEGSPFVTPDPDFPWGPHPRLAYGSFQGHGTVQQQRPGAAHAIWAFWSGPDRAFSHWYVNFQEPFRRIDGGIETFDQALDLVVEPDGSYRWKDVEQFESMVADGLFTAAEARAIRAEADQAATELDAGRRWWDESWADWTPPPDW